jgi:hypothetical protein
MQERRRSDRRTPLPWYRRPWAFAGYGVVATLALVLLGSTLIERGPAPVSRDEELMDVQPGAPVAVEPDPGATQAAGEPEDAYGSSGVERLMLEGDAARGRLVRTELFCGSPSPVGLGRADRVESAIAAVVDEQSRVPAAECKWGQSGTTRREDFLLIVPPEMAAAFAGTPEVTDAFVRRRHVHGVVEWVGRSDALSLRTAGVLRGLVQ